MIVLNVKENDDPNTTAIRFLSDNNLTRKHYSAIVDQIRMIKDQWKSHPGMESCIVKNLVLKENKGIPTFRKNSIPDKFSRSKSPIKSTSFLFDTKVRPQIANNSLNETNNRVLFRLNFDIGKGKMAKFTFKEKDNVAK